MNGKSTWKYNKLLTARRNYFVNGGATEATKGGSNFIQSFTSALNPANIDWANVAAGAVGDLGYSLLSGNKNSTAGNVVKALGDLTGSPLLKTFAGGINAIFGSSLNTENIKNIENNIGTLRSYTADASDLDTAAKNMANAPVGMLFNKKDVGSDGLFSNKATRKYNSLKNDMAIGTQWVQDSNLNNIENILNSNNQMYNSNYAAYGGKLFKDGGKINEKNKTQNTKATKDTRRVDFSKYKSTLGRDFSVENMEELQDSLITRGFSLPQRTAIMSSILHESGGNPKAVSKDGKFKGIAQWGADRFPNTWNLGEQIHYLLESSMDSSSPNWSDGGGGNPYIGSALQGYNTFWNGNLGPYNSAMYYNKGYIRPREEQARVNRGVESGNMWKAAVNNNSNTTSKNTKKTKNTKAFGGELNTQGGDFTNGLLSINEGGSHETNPYEGIQLGVDPEGTPNLVEEGETIFNDYVFSKRLKVPNSLRNKYNLRGTKNLTFAEASKKLSKESEERPNDPISKRGLIAIMADLAYNQEKLKEIQQVKKYAYGGNLFDIGGTKTGANQTLNYNNKTTGLYFGSSPEVFNPYASDGTIDWSVMYGANSPYMKRRQYVLDNWDSEGVQNWLQRYVEGINNYNKDRQGYVPITKDNLTKDIFEARTFDKAWGGMHAGIDYAGDPERNIVTKHMLRGKDALTEMAASDIYYPGRNITTGKTWKEAYGDKYSILDNGNYTTEYDPKTNTETRTYFYDPVKTKDRKNNYYLKNAEGKYELVSGDNPYLQIANLGNYEQVNSTENDSGGSDFYYDPKEKDPVIKPLDTRLRYAPAIGLGISAITDALGLTNKPDYSNANAILEASRSAGAYQPVRFNPIGNYLTYRPFDRDYAINKMEAEAGATRRNLMNTSGGNRATAMAGILAADNNVLNQIGALTRQAEEYNLAQRKEVEDFNRETNKVNSQGFLQADMANQNALLNSRDFTLRNTIAAAEMREKARLAADAAKSANLSNFLTSLGDIGRENVATNWRNFLAATDTNLPEQYQDLLGFSRRNKTVGNNVKSAKNKNTTDKKNNVPISDANRKIVEDFLDIFKGAGYSFKNLTKRK